MGIWDWIFGVPNTPGHGSTLVGYQPPDPGVGRARDRLINHVVDLYTDEKQRSNVQDTLNKVSKNNGDLTAAVQSLIQNAPNQPSVDASQRMAYELGKLGVDSKTVDQFKNTYLGQAIQNTVTPPPAKFDPQQADAQMLQQIVDLVQNFHDEMTGPQYDQRVSDYQKAATQQLAPLFQSQAAQQAAQFKLMNDYAGKIGNPDLRNLIGGTTAAQQMYLQDAANQAYNYAVSPYAAQQAVSQQIADRYNLEVQKYAPLQAFASLLPYVTPSLHQTIGGSGSTSLASLLSGSGLTGQLGTGLYQGPGAAGSVSYP